MQSTWDLMIGSCDMIACVYCGTAQTSTASSKSMSAAHLYKLPWCDDAVSRTFKNIINQAIQEEQRDSDCDADDCCVWACTNCFNCMSRRMERGLYVLPLQEVKWRIQTMQKITQKSMDSRVLFRMATALCEVYCGRVPNYYFLASLFTESEKKLMRDIAKCPTMSHIDHILAMHIVQENGDPPFMTNSKTVEFIRQHYRE